MGRRTPLQVKGTQTDKGPFGESGGGTRPTHTSYTHSSGLGNVVLTLQSHKVTCAWDPDCLNTGDRKYVRVRDRRNVGDGVVGELREENKRGAPTRDDDSSLENERPSEIRT